jgi:hypothetical protein
MIWLRDVPTIVSIPRLENIFQGAHIAKINYWKL